MPRLLYIVLALLLAVPVAEARKKSAARSVADADTRAVSAIYMESVRHRLAGRNDAAYELLGECLRRSPDMPEALFDMARLKLSASVLLDSVGVAEGDSLLQKAYESARDNDDIRDYLIFRLMARRNYDEAASLLEQKCAKGRPEYADLGTLVQLYEIQGRYPEALAAVARLEQIEGPDAVTAWERYQIYECTGEREKAAATYDSLLVKALPDPATSPNVREQLIAHPRYYEILSNLQDQMMAALGASDSLRVVELCRQGEMLRPDYLWSYLYEAFSLFEQGDTLKAIDACQRGINYIKLPTDDNVAKELYQLCGDLYSAVGNLEASTECYEFALQIDSTSALILNNYAYQLVLLGRDLDRAEEMSRRSLDADPDNPTYLDTYAWVLHHRGRSREARKYIDKAIRLSEEPDETLTEHRREIYKK